MCAACPEQGVNAIDDEDIESAEVTILVQAPMQHRFDRDEMSAAVANKSRQSKRGLNNTGLSSGDPDSTKMNSLKLTLLDHKHRQKAQSKRLRAPQLSVSQQILTVSATFCCPQPVAEPARHPSQSLTKTESL